MIRVLVVDDHELVRSGITRMLADNPDIDVIGQASSGEEAIDCVRENRPDIVLMDIRMPAWRRPGAFFVLMIPFALSWLPPVQTTLIRPE